MKKSLKKAFAVTMALAMSVGVFACSKTDNKETTKANETKEQQTKQEASYKLLKDGVLTVGCEVGYPPFEQYADDGVTPIGYDMDLINEVGKRLGVTVKVINTSFDGIFAGLDVNYDCVCSGVTVTEKRKGEMLFSTSYIDNYQAVVVNADSTLEVNAFKDLDGKSIALQKGTTSDELIGDLKSTGTITSAVIANEKVTSCFTQMSNGEVDAVVCDSTVASEILAKNPGKYKIIFTDTEEPESFAIAFGLKNVELQKAVNECLAQMKKDGFLDDTYKYWFGAED